MSAASSKISFSDVYQHRWRTTPCTAAELTSHVWNSPQGDAICQWWRTWTCGHLSHCSEIAGVHCAAANVRRVAVCLSRPAPTATSDGIIALTCRLRRLSLFSRQIFRAYDVYSARWRMRPKAEESIDERNARDCINNGGAMLTHEVVNIVNRSLDNIDVMDGWWECAGVSASDSTSPSAASGWYRCPRTSAHDPTSRGLQREPLAMLRLSSMAISKLGRLPSRSVGLWKRDRWWCAASLPLKRHSHRLLFAVRVALFTVYINVTELCVDAHRADARINELADDEQQFARFFHEPVKKVDEGGAQLANQCPYNDVGGR